MKQVTCQLNQYMWADQPEWVNCWHWYKMSFKYVTHAIEMTHFCEIPQTMMWLKIPVGDFKKK